MKNVYKPYSNGRFNYYLKILYFCICVRDCYVSTKYIICEEYYSITQTLYSLDQNSIDGHVQ